MAELPADTVRDLPHPTLLDLGTGTGQVPRALLKALPSLAYIEAVDRSRPMLDQARAPLTPVLGECTLNLVQASADVYEPLAPLPGEDRWTPDLVTCCRAYHWTNGPDVLAMAHRVAAPQATPAITGDVPGHPRETPAGIQDRDADRDVFWRLSLTRPQITQVRPTAVTAGNS
ncbi:class I SAM-dependent methyltransferase [Streptomyces sp. NBC_00647]|uniref:class I SAM-dependent methyltransferase n=1 Tax=Streptomyces sp. NBC_00647 TaxID=2975796 RepID=UPI00324937C1